MDYIQILITLVENVLSQKINQFEHLNEVSLIKVLNSNYFIYFKYQNFKTIWKYTKRYMAGRRIFWFVCFVQLLCIKENLKNCIFIFEITVKVQYKSNECERWICHLIKKNNRTAPSLMTLVT